MNSMLESLGVFLADFHLLAATLLAVVVVAQMAMRQPARRMAVTKSTLAALTALAVLCALPGWSLIHLMTADATPVPAATFASAPAAQPMVVEIKDNIARFPVERAKAPVGSVAPLSNQRASISWPAALFTLYGGGSAAVVAWLVIGSVSAGRVRRSAASAPDELVEFLRRIAGGRRAPGLLVSDQVEMAAAMGVWRAQIILGTGLVSSGRRSNDSLAAVLAHEWAHIRNGDLRTLALSRLLLVLLWAQPLYWLFRKRMRLDQETLADAAAVDVSGRVDYAEQLLEWARRAAELGPRGPAPRLAGAVGLWEGTSQLKVRVAALLDDKFTLFRECSRRWRVGSACLLLAAASALSLVTVRPKSRAADDAGAKPAQAATIGAKHTATAEAVGSFVAVTAGDPLKPGTAYKPNVLAYRVLDETGKPVAGAEVLLYRGHFRDGNYEPIKKATTNDAGEVEFVDLCTADQVAEFKRMKDAGDYYGNTVQRSFLTAVRREGLATIALYQNEYGVGLYGAKQEATMAPGRELTGRVTGPDGKPAAGALVAAGSYANQLAIEGVNAVRTDADGRYTFKDRQPLDAKAAKKIEAAMMHTAAKATEAMTEEELNSRRPKLGYDLKASSIVVTHPDFAVATKAGGDIPGTNDIQLRAAATLVGRVVSIDPAQKVAGALVRAVSKPEPLTMETESGEEVAMFPAYSQHSALTRTDGEGRYQIANLAEGSYDVWASSEVDDLREAPWVNRGLSEVRASAGPNPTEAPDLVVGRPGVLRAQLVDAKTGAPLKLSGKNPTVRVQTDLVGGPQMQDSILQTAKCSADGVFEMSVVPGKVRLMAFVFPDGGGEFGKAEYRSGDDSWMSGPMYDAELAKTVQVKVPVRSVKELQSIRDAEGAAGKLQYAGKTTEAIAAYTEAIRRFPDEAQLLRSRAYAHIEIGNDAAALADLTAALKLVPSDVGAQLTIVGLLASSPIDAVRNGARAVELAEQAMATLRAAGQLKADSGVLSYLAAAYAEAGQFDKAVATQEQVVEGAPRKEKAAAQARLELYRSGKPYRRQPASQRTLNAVSAETPASAPTASLQTIATGAVQATKPNPEKFVRIVVGQDGAMTFEEETTTWEALPALLEKVADREKTVLEIAIATDEMSVREANNAVGIGFRLAGQYKFLYGSDVGVHPLGSKGGANP